MWCDVQLRTTRELSILELSPSLRRHAAISQRLPISIQQQTPQHSKASDSAAGSTTLAKKNETTLKAWTFTLSIIKLPHVFPSSRRGGGGVPGPEPFGKWTNELVTQVTVWQNVK